MPNVAVTTRQNSPEGGKLSATQLYFTSDEAIITWFASSDTFAPKP